MQAGQKEHPGPVRLSEIGSLAARLSGFGSGWTSPRELAPGIFHFRSDPDFLVADYRVLDKDALTALGRYRDTDNYALVQDPRSSCLLDGTVLKTERHPQHADLVPIIDRPTHSVIFAPGPARSLIVIHAGLRWRGYATKRALADFDTHIATSAHEKLSARAILKRRLEAD